MTRVLVVDDDPVLAGLIQEALHDDGYCVRAALSAAAASASILEHWPDIMLLDVHMPGTDGWTFLAACRQDAWAAQLPVVMLSAPPAVLPANEWRLGFLPKPFDLAMLTRTVQQLVANPPARTTAPGGVEASAGNSRLSALLALH